MAQPLCIFSTHTADRPAFRGDNDGFSKVDMTALLAMQAMLHHFHPRDLDDQTMADIAVKARRMGRALAAAGTAELTPLPEQSDPEQTE